MPSIESMVIRVVVDVSNQLSHRLAAKTELPQVAATTAATNALLTDLARPDIEALETYLDSPDFTMVVAQKRIGNLAGKSAKDQLREGLRLAGMSDHPLSHVADVVHDVMVAACNEVAPHFGGAGTRIDRSDLFTSATNNSLMLKRLKSATRVHSFAARMRGQVAALHSRIRMPHIGVSRSVRYDQLYVTPTLVSSFAIRLGAPGERVVVQGDPGAGKSTLAAKFAHDIAVDGTDRVPFLLVLRELTSSLDEGGRDLLHHLERLCLAPYNVQPPRDGVEYLLRTGRAVVILDGLDELVRTELRRRVVSLVEGFAHLHPLVPILVTARKIGYEDAPLSTELFQTCHIAEFDDEQVTTYVGRWFALDEASSSVERERLARSFIEDSRQIPELRSNPLLLTLLCALYSSDRYLPRNLAQVYERCALMMFDQWDAKRGIEVPLGFEGRLRGAVQHLAWQMFTAPESGRAQSRTRIVRMLTDYLDVRIDDQDESSAMATKFLEFCTGRSWILTDVGAEQYGFTHRTFLEYFAAEQLVRTHRTAESLWSVLRPNISQWDVVAQIVLQLHDRNVEGGLDALLIEMVDGGLTFATRSLQHLHPSHRTVRAITAAALDRTVFIPPDLRFDKNLRQLNKFDKPLLNCMSDCLPAHLPVVERALRDRLDALIEQGEIGAVLAVDHLPLSGADDRWNALRGELISRHRRRLVDINKTLPWAGGFAMSEPGFLSDVLDRHGMIALYTTCLHLDHRYASAAWRLMRDRGSLLPRSEADALAAAIVEQRTPWLKRGRYDPTRRNIRPDESGGDLRLLLSLPFLEMSETRPQAHRWLEQNQVAPVAREFVTRWAGGEINVLEPAPEPLRPHQEPR